MLIKGRKRAVEYSKWFALGIKQDIRLTSLYEYFVECVKGQFDGPVGTGVFGAHMEFELLNNGPVTIWFDSDEMEKK